MRYWDEKDGNGKPLTDGRVCLVIKSDADPDMPPIRTYGRSKEEVLDKLATTTETAQVEIHRLRKSKSVAVVPPAAANTSAPVVQTGAARVTADELARATVDLSNPAKAADALKVILRAGNIDIEQAEQDRIGRQVAATCNTWQGLHPEFPYQDERNKRLLIERAIARVGYRNITLEALDAAYEQLQELNMIFEPSGSTVQPLGREEPRAVVREATTYRRNALRGAEPAPVVRETAQVQAWRKIAESGTTKELGEAIKNQPGFKQWMDKEYARTA